jgi:hypothetical protein
MHFSVVQVHFCVPRRSIPKHRTVLRCGCHCHVELWSSTKQEWTVKISVLPLPGIGCRAYKRDNNSLGVWRRNGNGFRNLLPKKLSLLALLEIRLPVYTSSSTMAVSLSGTCAQVHLRYSQSRLLSGKDICWQTRTIRRYDGWRFSETFKSFIN